MHFLLNRRVFYEHLIGNYTRTSKYMGVHIPSEESGTSLRYGRVPASGNCGPYEKKGSDLHTHTHLHTPTYTHIHTYTYAHTNTYIIWRWALSLFLTKCMIQCEVWCYDVKQSRIIRYLQNSSVFAMLMILKIDAMQISIHFRSLLGNTMILFCKWININISNMIAMWL